MRKHLSPRTQRRDFMVHYWCLCIFHSNRLHASEYIIPSFPYVCTYKLNEVLWTAGSDHILCATEGTARCGELEIMSFKNDEINLVDTFQAHSDTCDRLVIDPRYLHCQYLSDLFNLSKSPLLLWIIISCSMPCKMSNGIQFVLCKHGFKLLCWR